jgi:hypothetical protein
MLGKFLSVCTVGSFSGRAQLRREVFLNEFLVSRDSIEVLEDRRLVLSKPCKYRSTRKT